jgi:hypothetical protein
MKTMNQIISTVLLVVAFTTSLIAKTDSLPSNVIERNNVSAQIKTLFSNEMNGTQISNASENVVVKVMLNEFGNSIEVKVFCDNQVLREKIEAKFKTMLFKDFQEYTYYYFKVTINKV